MSFLSIKSRHSSAKEKASPNYCPEKNNETYHADLVLSMIFITSAHISYLNHFTFFVLRS